MNIPRATTTLLLTIAILSASVSAQFWPEGTQPSPEQLKAAQEQFSQMLKTVFEESFDKSDVDDSESLDKDEMLEFVLKAYTGQAEAMTERGMPVPQPDEEDLSQMRENAKQRLDEMFKDYDTDGSGDITLEEVLNAMFRDDDSGETEEGENENTSDDADTSASDVSQESATDAQ